MQWFSLTPSPLWEFELYHHRSELEVNTCDFHFLNAW